MSLLKASKEILRVRGLLQHKTLFSTDTTQILNDKFEKSELEGTNSHNDFTYHELNFPFIWFQKITTNLKYSIYVYKGFNVDGILAKVLGRCNIDINNETQKPVFGLFCLDLFTKSGDTDDTDEDDESDETEESKGGPVRQSGGRLGTLDAASEAGYFHKTDKARLLDLKRQLKNKAKDESNPENKED